MKAKATESEEVTRYKEAAENANSQLQSAGVWSDWIDSLFESIEKESEGCDQVTRLAELGRYLTETGSRDVGVALEVLEKLEALS